MNPIRIFISSVQKELEPERLALFSLLTTDPFLKNHIEPVLFEKLPPPSRPIQKPYLKVLKTCRIFVLMLDREYAPEGVVKSPTHEEYDLSRSMGIPALAMIKGRHDTGREIRTQEFFKQIKKDAFTYKRFIDRIDLKKEVSAWLYQVLREEYGLIPAQEQEESGDKQVSEQFIRGKSVYAAAAPGSYIGFPGTGGLAGRSDPFGAMDRCRETRRGETHHGEYAG